MSNRTLRAQPQPVWLLMDAADMGILFGDPKSLLPAPLLLQTRAKIFKTIHLHFTYYPQLPTRMGQLLLPI